MSVDVATPSSRTRVRLFVFSITVDWRRLEAEIAGAGGDQLCVLTSQWLFPFERSRVIEKAGRSCQFRTFHDLLDQADMERCDEEADVEVLARHGSREGRVLEYYETVKLLKNRTAADRLLREFDIEGGAVLSGDLGIVPMIWIKLGLSDCTPTMIETRLPLWARLHKLIFSPIPCHYLRWREDWWLLIGRPQRVGQYLEDGAVVLQPAGRLLSFVSNLHLALTMRLRVAPARLRTLSRVCVFIRWFVNRPVSQLAASVHEDHLAVALLAEALKLDYVNLQDSFLPEYYPSRYLLYRPQVRRFYVWDEFSRGIFIRHGLESVVWRAYRSWALPAIPSPGVIRVRRIVYLSSGAGDWTALKNRSDEDRALALLIEVARQRPDLTIYYRPHPLWLHPEHQGLNSIQRAMACILACGLSNIVISQGAKADGRMFSLTGNLSAVSSSVDEDIAWADLVLGEHSQTMLVAARRGKVIAGINPSRHPPFLGDYARVGFPIVSSADELVALVGRMGSDPAFAGEYNAAIRNHNRVNCGCVEGEPGRGRTSGSDLSEGS